MTYKVLRERKPQAALRVAQYCIANPEPLASATVNPRLEQGQAAGSSEGGSKRVKVHRGHNRPKGPKKRAYNKAEA